MITWKAVPKMVSVVKVVPFGLGQDTDYVELSCGHAMPLGHDDPNVSLVGAEIECERHMEPV